jgi:hypothetical protein
MKPALAGHARRIGAIVGTGSVVRKSTMMVLQRAGFSTRSPCDVPGTTESSPSASPPVQRDRVFERDLVIIADHHQRSVTDAVQLTDRQGRFVGVHPVKLGDHDRVVTGTVRRHLAVQALEPVAPGASRRRQNPQ